MMRFDVFNGKRASRVIILLVSLFLVFNIVSLLSLLGYTHQTEPTSANSHLPHMKGSRGRTAERRIIIEKHANANANAIHTFEEDYQLSLRGIDLYRYRWTMLERDFCSKRHPKLFLLIVVHTAVDHFKHRQAIRDTWGDARLYPKYKSAVIFALGETNNATLRSMVVKESIRYRDMIQQSFIDAYKLLVLKGLMWIRFVAEYCPHVPFILKIDDDAVVNRREMVKYLVQRVRRNSQPRSRVVMCRIMDGSVAIRDNTSKWYISEKEFGDEAFTKYCSGLAFILTNDLIRPMLKHAVKAPFVWVDDYFLSGYLAAKANATFHDISSLYEMSEGNAEASMLSNAFILFATVGSADQHKRIFKQLESQYRSV